MNDFSYCTGCKRHVTEIAYWSAMPETEARRCMAQLPARDIERPFEGRWRMRTDRNRT